MLCVCMPLSVVGEDLVRGGQQYSLFKNVVFKRLLALSCNLQVTSWESCSEHVHSEHLTAQVVWDTAQYTETWHQHRIIVRDFFYTCSILFVVIHACVFFRMTLPCCIWHPLHILAAQTCNCKLSSKELSIAKVPQVSNTMQQLYDFVAAVKMTFLLMPKQRKDSFLVRNSNVCFQPLKDMNCAFVGCLHHDRGQHEKNSTNHGWRWTHWQHNQSQNN